MKKEIYIIRHGETDFNNQGIVQGRGINSSINDRGKEQARKFYENYNDVGFDKIYVSTLNRTYESIQPFVGESIEIEKHHGLDEISWGIHEGKCDGDTFKKFYEMLHLWKQGDVDVGIEEGESPIDVQIRQKQFLSEILNRDEEKILICSHGRAMRILLCTMLNRPLSEIDEYPHNNLCLYKLNYDNGAFNVEVFNDISHINGE